MRLWFWPVRAKTQPQKKIPEKLFFLRGFHRTGCPHLGSFALSVLPGQLSYLGSCLAWAVVLPGQLSYLGSCLAWAVVLPGQLSCLGSCLPGQLSPGQLSAWAVVTWAVVLAPSFVLQVFVQNEKKTNCQISKPSLLV